MNDTQKPPPKATLRNVKAFLDEHGVGTNCPRCGNTEWFTVEEAPYAYIPVDDETAKSTNTRRMIIAVFIYCGRCGFISTHHAAPFREWLEKKKDEADG